MVDDANRHAGGIKAMRSAASFLIPFTLITLYYALCVGVMWLLLIESAGDQGLFPYRRSG